MTRKALKLDRIEHDRIVTKPQDGEFLQNLQKGLLLALREREIINLSQYQRAEEKLHKGRHT